MGWLDKYQKAGEVDPARKEAQQKAYRTVQPSDYDDISNYLRWATNTTRNAYDDPRSEDAWKFYLQQTKNPKYLKPSGYKPKISKDPNAKYYSVDSDLEQAIFNSLKDKVQYDKISPVGEEMISATYTPEEQSKFMKANPGLKDRNSSGNIARVLGNFSASKGKDEKGEYVSYYDKYDFPDFVQKRAQGEPYEVYGRVYYPKKHKGGVITDPRGQWAHPGKITRIPSNQITMEGVDYPVMGISDTGDTQMMQPGKDYSFDGSSVTEYPMMSDGGQKDKAIKCSNCGWSWKESNAGSDPMTCHKCGGQSTGKIQMQNGSWLNKYDDGGPTDLKKLEDPKYKIQQGDTLSVIAKQHNIPLSTLANANQLQNPNLIRTGAELAIPKKFTKELSFDEIPTADNKKIVIDNFSKHYDYVLEGEKLYYKVKSGKTWADISSNEVAKQNIAGFLDKNNYWDGYNSNEQQILNKKEVAPLQNNTVTNSVFPFGNPTNFPSPAYNTPINKVPETIVKNNKNKPAPEFIKNNSSRLVSARDNTRVVIPQIKSKGQPNNWLDNFVEDVGDVIGNTVSTGINGIKRKLVTNITGESDDVRVTGTNPNNRPLDVVSYYKNANVGEISSVIEVPDGSGRQYKQQVIPTKDIKFGVRNRGEYKDLNTEGLEITTFQPFGKTTLPDNTTVLALDSEGKLHTGAYKDFKDKSGYSYSKTFRNKIVDFPETNGKNEYVDGAKSGNPKFQQPKITVIDDKGKTVNGSLNILVKDDSKKDFYGSVQGGRILFVNPTNNEQYLVSGSLSHIKEQFKKLKGNNKYLEAYTLDNGTYSRGLSYKDKKLTPDRLKAYDNENTSGGNGLYIVDYGTPLNKFKEEYAQTPNVRTEQDESYKKGHGLRNEIKNVVLHHTAFTNTKTNEQEVKKQYMTKGANTSHVVIQENGKRIVYASPEQVTFHAGKSKWNNRENVNDFSIGVEFQGDTNKSPLTPQQIESFVEYYTPIAKKYNLSIKDIITHQMIAPGRKPDVTDKEYKRVLQYLKAKKYK